MKKRIALLVLVLTLVLCTGVDAWSNDSASEMQLLSTHNIWIYAQSWESFPISCAAGDMLSGEYVLTSDGDRFPGDETKYDNWLLSGIDFLILDESNYELWIEELPATPIIELLDHEELVWSIEIPHDGLWYVVYFNDSIFMKQLAGSINHAGQNDALFILIGIISVGSLLTITFIYWKKK